MSTFPVPRSFGGTLILQSVTPPVSAAPTLSVSAHFRSGAVIATHRSGKQIAKHRDGVITPGGR